MTAPQSVSGWVDSGKLAVQDPPCCQHLSSSRLGRPGSLAESPWFLRFHKWRGERLDKHMVYQKLHLNYSVAEIKHTS